ncbi:MAG: 1-deoxy-D-xylulose-5-phosphate synthase [Ruminococcaceae bacterium]|nr:1-deoxy-D-xylulose-5-phosphate synthase [Oscillospiraceae bacterium]
MKRDLNMKYEILDTVSSLGDLKKMPKKDLPALCDDIRRFLLDTVEETGGHLASNLGVVELTVGLHRVFDSPRDHIIFDVGHQAYVHKLLTGRRDRFSDLRRPGGLSGFTARRESEHDPFGAGHSSTSISAALGFAEADALNKSDAYTVCVIGDGAYTGGMVHEALNNCRPDLRLIIVLNENEMSISKNKGAFASYLAKVRVSKRYRRWKDSTGSLIDKIPLLGKPMHRLLSFIKNGIKRIIYPANYFEDLGLYYIGPVDGNDTKAVEKAFCEAKELGKCCVVHTYTIKGKGYAPAESSPDGFHSVQSRSSDNSTLHGVFAEELIDIARNDENVVAITAAMGIGTGLVAFEKQYPDRYFDVGIAEEHALTFSAGLAAAGKRPYVAIYSTFLQRGYDNIVHDIALQDLPVHMMIDRAGLALSDGATHHGIFDVAFLGHIPNMEIYAPVTYGSLKEIMRITASASRPVAIRYANSAEIGCIKNRFYSDGDYTCKGIRTDFDIASVPEHLFVTYGNITEKVIEAADSLKAEGINVGIILVEQLKPHRISAELIAGLLPGVKSLLFVEEGILNGGYSMISASLIRDIAAKASIDISRMQISFAAIDDSFAVPSVPMDIYEYLSLSSSALEERMKKTINR